MDGWTLEFDGFDPELVGLREALCTLGNGYVATRGALPEAVADGVHYPGTYLAGGYGRLVTEIAGRAVENEDLVNLPNWLPLLFRASGGDWIDLRRVEVLHHRFELDLRHGVLVRHVRVQDPGGRRTALTQRRFVSMDDPHLAGLESTFVAENWSGPLQIRSALDGRVKNTGVPRYRSLDGQHLIQRGAEAVDDEIIRLEVEAKGSHLRFSEAQRTRVSVEREGATMRRRPFRRNGLVGHDIEVEVREGEPMSVEKIVGMFSSRDHAVANTTNAAISRASTAGTFDRCLTEHALAWDQLWRRFDIRIEGPGSALLVLRAHIFHLLQTVSHNTIDLDVGVPARGLHGEAYRGHVFWDELFIFPFLNFQLPALTRSLLGYRFRRLFEARRAAKDAGHDGAMFPWQSGSDGREESQVLHLNPRSGRWLPDNSRLQRHVGIAVAYNAWQHYQVTGDLDFLRFRGGPMILEVARFWSSLTTYSPSRRRYEIHGVMGPDEYHDGYVGADAPGLDNNAYTNLMAAWVLCRALELLELLPPHQRTELLAQLGLTRRELRRWAAISRRMYVPFNADGTISQFEGWDDLEELDWVRYIEAYGDLQRLDRILEAEGDTPNRYKLSKQADVLMLFYLLSREELRRLFAQLGYPFDPDTDIAQNTEYYVRRTSHGSTLSRVVHSWVLARIDRPRSWQFLLDALGSDIVDIQGGTTAEGIHLGAMAGTVDLVERCYGGIETRGDVLWIDPVLPDEVTALEFGVHFRGHRVSLVIGPDRIRVNTWPGVAPSIRVGLAGKVVHMGPGETREAQVSSPARSLSAELAASARPAMESRLTRVVTR